jgi:glycosyltransferase involved in cell wall biosynthesis
VGDAAVLVDPYSEADIARGIDQVLTDHEFRGVLVARGRSHARRFSWERSARAVHAAYLRAVGAPAGALEATETS